MLAIIIVLLFWIFAVAGYGSLFARVKNQLGEQDPSPLDLLHPLLGLGALSAAANVINFFLPISGTVALIFLLAGWLLFIKNSLQTRKPNWGMVSFAAVWLLAIAWARAIHNLDAYYDSGFYGLPTVRWLQANPLPLGLANLHSRLGLNSSWFSFASLIQLPFVPSGAPVANEILVFFAGLAIFKGLQGLFRKDWTTNNIFLALTGLVIITPVLSTFAIMPLANDVPVFWLTLGQAFILLNLLDRKIKLSYALWLSSTLAWIAITIKLSALTLLFVPVTILVLRFDEIKEGGRAIVRAAGWIAASAAGFCLPWAVRSFMLSGCWLFPVVSTCQPRVPWALPPDKVDMIALIVRAWARENDFDYAGVLSNWNWVSKWLALQLRSTELDFLLVLQGLSLVLLVVSQVRAADKGIVRREWSLQAPFYLGILIWFFSAPAIRFGSGNFWAVALLMLTFGLARLLAVKTPAIALVKFFVTSLLSTVLLVFGLRFLAGSVSQAASVGNHWLLPLESPKVEIRPFITDSHQVIYEPVADDFLCWDVQLLCTPYPDAKLNFVEQGGEYKMFFIADAGE